MSAFYLLRKDVNCDGFMASITLPVSFAWLQAAVAASLPLQLPSLAPGTSLPALLLCLSPAGSADHSFIHLSLPIPLLLRGLGLRV